MTNESKTLFIPLYGKALMSRENFAEDKTAEEIVRNEAENLKDVDTSRKLAIYMAMRAMQYDEAVLDFVKQNPKCIIIHLGCGLDSRINRTDVDAVWYDLDFPDVIALRKKYYKENEQYTMLSSSVTDLTWLDKIPYKNENVLIIAEGLSMYLSETDMKNIIEALGRKFGKCTFIFDAYSTFAAKMSKYRNPVNEVDARIDFAMDNPQILENENVRCVINNDIILKKYVDKLKGTDRVRFKFMGSAGKKLYRIYGYEINM